MPTAGPHRESPEQSHIGRASEKSGTASESVSESPSGSKTEGERSESIRMSEGVEV